LYIVIAGGGLKGMRLAETLVARRHDVLVIDPDPGVCDYVQMEIGAMAHVGTATSTKTLEAIGLRRADIAVALMREDANNLAFILLAKSYGVPRRLVRMREQDFEQAYLLAGATEIASSVTPIVDQLVLSIEYPEIKTLMRLGKGSIDVFEVAIPVDGRVVGMSIEAIAQLASFPPNCNFVAVESPSGGIEIAKGTTVIPAGADVTVLAKDVDLSVIVQLLTQSATGQPAGLSAQP
jgi:trk system potassium uptake protein TrkA